MTKTFFLVICFLSCFSCFGKRFEKQERIPLWLSQETISEIFPEDLYLARCGFGTDADEARLKADAELSNYFSSKVRSVIHANEEYSNSQTSVSDKTETKKKLIRDIEVSSETELFALSHTEPFFEKKSKRYAVCAYINREKAWAVIEPKITQCAKKIEEIIRDSEQEIEPFSKVLLLNSAVKKFKGFYELYFTTLMLVPKKAASFDSVITEIQNATVCRDKISRKIKIFINVHGDETNRVKTKMNEILSQQGFSVMETKKRKALDMEYFAIVDANTQIAENGGICTCYPQIRVAIEGSSETAIVSWAKQIQKISSYTKDACERMALARIEMSLQNDFVNECLERGN